MEANREEAIRAKSIAEQMMRVKDFAVARRFALKARQLYAGLENISQMLVVCEVHCAANQKLFNGEMDWYGILQVEQTANKVKIKQQFKKFALQLHPDKNKFPGAEAAFKLIGEAQILLLDKRKRYLNNAKRKSSSAHPLVPPYQPQHNATHSMSSRVQNDVRFNCTSVNLQDQQRPKSAAGEGFRSSQPTFWKICPFCSGKYKYDIEAINKILVCQFCSKPFVAYQSMEGPIEATNLSQTAQSDYNKSFSSEKGSGNVNGKRRKLEEESSDSFDDGSSSDNEEELLINEDGDFNAEVNLESFGRHPRRSTRKKQQVSYQENLSDDDMNDGDGVKKKRDNGCQHKISKPKINQSSISNAKLTSGPEIYACPDAEFNDFDGQRNKACFSAGQIWALYDNLDAMPRIYARIVKVSSDGSEVRIMWLEPDPDDEDESEWVNGDLPAVCGRFKHGKTENTKDCMMFSHLVRWEKGYCRCTYNVFPRKGETWALYKNWDVIWRSDADAKQKYEYELAEVLTDYTEDTGTCVAFLVKVKAFVSLFCQTSEEGMNEYQIPPEELFRFSHKVPSFRMTGKERDGVPKGCFELDPTALPLSFTRLVGPEDLTDGVGGVTKPL